MFQTFLIGQEAIQPIGDCNTLKSFPRVILGPSFRPNQTYWIIALDNSWCPCYDCIESGPTETEKVGFYRWSLKIRFLVQFWAQKGPGRPPGDQPAMHSTQKGCLLGVPS